MSACPLCGSVKTSLVSSRDRLGRRVRTLLCEDCGLVFNAPGARARALIEAYIEEDQRSATVAAWPDIGRTVRVLAQMERAIEDYWPLIGRRRRLLDVCAGTGEFAFLAKHLGLEVEVLEPNPDYAIHCSRILGLDVHAQTFWDKDYPAGSFDIIRVHHLLVHAPDPVAQLGRLHGWLKDDGLLYIELPNLEAEAAVRPRGALFDAGHVVSFNPATMRSALGLAGFSEVEETQDRHRDATAGFFRKSPPGDRVGYVAGNAKRISDVITRHYARAKPHASLGQLVEGIASRAAERREVKAVSGHRDAAEQAVRRLRVKLGLRDEKAPQGRP